MRVRGAVVDLGGFLGGWVGGVVCGFLFLENPDVEWWMEKVKSFFYGDGKGEKKGGVVRTGSGW